MIVSDDRAILLVPRWRPLAWPGKKFLCNLVFGLGFGLTLCIWFLLFEQTKFAMMATCDVGGSCESLVCARFRSLLKLVVVLVVTSVVVDVSV